MQNCLDLPDLHSELFSVCAFGSIHPSIRPAIRPAVHSSTHFSLSPCPSSCGYAVLAVASVQLPAKVISLLSIDFHMSLHSFTCLVPASLVDTTFHQPTSSLIMVQGSNTVVSGKRELHRERDKQERERAKKTERETD